MDQLDEVNLGEFERTGELYQQLVDTVEPLEENGATFVRILAAGGVATTVGKFVAE